MYVESRTQGREDASSFFSCAQPLPIQAAGPVERPYLSLIRQNQTLAVTGPWLAVADPRLLAGVGSECLVGFASGYWYTQGPYNG